MAGPIVHLPINPSRLKTLLQNPDSLRLLSRIAMVVIAGLFIWFAVATGGDLRKEQTRDFHEFFSAAEAMVQGEDIYKAGRLGYIYPPLLAFLLTPLVGLGEVGAAWVWMVINIGLLFATLFVSAHDATKRLGPGSRAFLWIGAAIGLVLIADKIRADLAMGQSNIFIVCCWTMALYTVDRKPLTAATLLGLAANVKYVTLIAVPYLIFRRRYKAAILTCVMSAVWSLVPAGQLGFDKNFGYLTNAVGGLTRMSSHEGEVADSKSGAGQKSDGRARIASLADIRSVSIPSYAARMTDGTIRTPATLAITLAVLGAFAGGAWWMYRRNGVGLLIQSAADSSALLMATEWSGLMVIVLAFGPQTNPRHLVMLLPMFVLIGTSLTLKSARRERVVLLAMGTVLMFAALILPPGGATFEKAVFVWRYMSGVCWCLLICYLLFLWTTLQKPRPTA